MLDAPDPRPALYDSADWRALVNAIRAAPADDLRRLVAADYLDDHGEADRAELIRVGTETIRLRMQGTPAIYHPDQPDAPERLAALLNRERELIDLVRGPLCGDGIGSIQMTVSCGFLEAVECGWDGWVRNADRILAREPVQRVRLTTWPTWEYARIGWLLIGDPAQKRLWIPTSEGYDHSRRGVAELLLIERWPQMPAAGWELPTSNPGVLDDVRARQAIRVMRSADLRGSITVDRLSEYESVQGFEFEGVINGPVRILPGTEFGGLTARDRGRPWVSHRFFGVVTHVRAEHRNGVVVTHVRGRARGPVDTYDTPVNVRLEPSGLGPWPAADDEERR